jgi:hypothetical protein
MPVRRNGETLAQLLPRFDLVVASKPVDDEFTDEVIRSWWNTQAIRKLRVGIGHIIESPGGASTKRIPHASARSRYDSANVNKT